MNYLKNNIVVLRSLAGLNQSEFGKLFGLTRDNIASYERGTEPKLTTLLNIVNYFNISVEQIINEDLSKKMDSNLELKSRNAAITEHTAQPFYAPNVVTVDSQGNENIVFVPVKASAGYLNGYADPEFIDQLPAYRMPGISNGTFRMFEISGHSMKEALENGDKIIGEWVLPEDIKDEQVYIIVSKTDGICVKRCINRLKSENKLILKSDNKEFNNITIKADDILETWSAKLRLTSKFNNPSETLIRIADVEARLAFVEKNLLNKP